MRSLKRLGEYEYLGFYIKQKEADTMNLLRKFLPLLLFLPLLVGLVLIPLVFTSSEVDGIQDSVKLYK